MSQYDTDIKKFIEERSIIQNKILQYFDGDYKSNSKDLDKNNVDVKEIFRLLKNIIDNHHRNKDFLIKIEKIITFFKDDIKKSFTNQELFNFFSKSKIVLLVLFKNKMITINKSIIEALSLRSIMDFFWIEINSFYSDHQETNNEKEYKEKREIGENHLILPSLIRNDSIDEFVIYVNETNVNLNTKISQSPLETNLFLIGKEPTLIEYATFFGSIQIFKYLQNLKVTLTPSLWEYAIHSNNAEIIEILENNHVIPEDPTYEKVFIESIKCHHNEIANHLLNTFKLNNFYLDTYLKYSNYDLIPTDRKSYSENHFSINYMYDFIQNNQEFANLLIKGSYFNINQIEKGETLLLKAFEKNDTKIMELLIKIPELDLNIKYKKKGKEFTILTLAIEKKNINIIRLLLKNKNINPNIIIKMKDKEFTALSMSIEKKYEEVIQLLLDNKNIDLNTKFIIKGRESTVLSLAIEDENLNLIHKLLLDRKIKPDIMLRMEDGSIKTPLMMAMEKNNFKITQFLLSNKNIDINKKFNKKCTLLSMNLEKFNMANIRILLKREDINPNIKFKIGDKEYIPLLFAFEKKNKELIELLLSKKNINPNKKLKIKRYNKKTLHFETEEKTILSYAIENENIEVIKRLLLCEKLDLNLKLVTKENGTEKIIIENTYLHLAVMKRNDEIIRLLLNDKRTNSIPIM